MDILIKKTGAVFSKVDSQFAAVLLAAFPEQIEKYVPPAPPPRKAEWSCGTNRFGDKAALWLVTPGGERVMYMGQPENVAVYFKEGYAHCLPCPPAVLAEYAARCPLTPQQRAVAQEKLENERARQAEAAKNHGGRLFTYPANWSE